MQKRQLLRYSIASVTLIGAGLGAFLIACSDDEPAATATPLPDSGRTDSTTPDTGPGDPDSGEEDKRPLAKLQLVNAATDFGPSLASGALRVCYGLGAGGKQIIAPLPPLPDRKQPTAPFAALPIGTGGSVQGTGTDLTTYELTPYLMNAVTLFSRGIVKPDVGPGTACDALLGGADAGGALVEGKDYWKLPSIPAKTFLREKSYMLVLTGCAGDSDKGAKCGEGFVTGAPGNGNLKVHIFELDRTTTIAADKMGAQYIHASAAGKAALGPAIETPGFIAGNNDISTFRGVTGDGGVEGGAGAGYGTRTPLVQVVVSPTTDSFTVNPLVADLRIPLPLIQALSYGATVPDGGAYRTGAAFTFIAVGDPAEDSDAGGTFNTKKFHYIALPNDPATDTYKP